MNRKLSKRSSIMKNDIGAYAGTDGNKSFLHENDYIGRSTIDLKDTEMLYGSCFESLWSGLFDRKVSGLK